MDDKEPTSRQPDDSKDGQADDRSVENLTNSGRSWMKYSGMAVQMIATILIFVFGGMYLDEWLGTDPWLTVALSLLGVTAGLYVSLKDFL